MGALETIIFISEGVMAIFGAAILFLKPLRERLFKDKEQRAGVMCILRSEMLSTYYHNKADEKIRQYEFENFIACYNAYKAMGGNSFIDHIKVEVNKWEVIT